VIFDDGAVAGLGVEEWFVVFHERTESRALAWLAWGRFKHVSAFGYAGRAQAWVRVAYTSRRLAIDVCGREDEDRVLKTWSIGGPVLVMRARRTPRATWGRFGIWCVPLTAHLLGLPTCALRPDSLYRVLLANGAQRVDEDVTDGSRSP
jgi:hypothetical protein